MPKSVLKLLFLFIALQVFSYLPAQYINNIEILNNYKGVVFKPENRQYEYNDLIEEVITRKLEICAFPDPLDNSNLVSAGDNCDLLTLRYKVKNISSSSVNLLAEIEFIDCEYKKVYQVSQKTTSGFYNKKAVTKAVENVLTEFNQYAYVYNKPQKIVEPQPIASTETLPEHNEINDIQYRGGTDPLKGLDVASAKQEIQIGNYYALIIGIDNYKNEWPELKNAVHDAEAISKLLSTNYIFNDITTLYNEQATRNNIIRAFETLIAKANSNDNVFVYFSGHGEFNQAINKGFWVPVDANSKSISQYISNNDIQSLLSGIRSRHTLLISDACFSGDIFRGKTLTIPYENNFKYYHKVHSLPSRKAISSGGIEPVMDGGHDGHSIFTYYLLKALSENTKMFFDAGEVYDRIKIPVVNNSEQTPYYRPIKNTGDEGGQFIFIQKSAEE